MPEVPPIEYNRKDRTLTPEDPCTFAEQCTPSDYEVWTDLASQWIGSARIAARTPEDHQAVDRMLTYWGQLVESGSGCSALDCHQFVRPLVELTERARGLVVEWGGAGVDPPGAFDPIFPDLDLFPEIPGLELRGAFPWVLLALLFWSGSRNGDR